MLKVNGDFLSPISTVFDDDKLLGHMAELKAGGWIVIKKGNDPESRKSKGEALQYLRKQSDE